jgi:hypothetical protein
MTTSDLLEEQIAVLKNQLTNFKRSELHCAIVECERTISFLEELQHWRIKGEMKDIEVGILYCPDCNKLIRGKIGEGKK